MNRVTMTGEDIAMRQPSTPRSVERLFQTVPSIGRSYVLRAFLDAAREDYATTETVLRETESEFANMRTGAARGGLSSFVTHQIGFLIYQQFIDSPAALRDLANYALHTVVYEAALQSALGDKQGGTDRG